MLTRSDRLDVEAMHQASQELVGTHDFRSFCSTECHDEVTIRRLQHIEIKRWGGYIYLYVVANAFLKRMVRTIAGTLYQFGTGVLNSRSRMTEILAAHDRTQAGPSAPAHGLYFLGAEYPRQFAVPAPVTVDEFFQQSW